jgi:pyruvate,orthophosphate dikinase
MKSKYVYDLNEGSKDDVDFMSSKGANLCEVHRMGFRVPPAFIVSVDASIKYNNQDFNTIDTNLQTELHAAIERLEFVSKSKFGGVDGQFPLMLSIRGGASVSKELIVGAEEVDLSVDTVNSEVMDVLGAPESWCIPGMKESVLGLGFTDEVAKHLASLTSTSFAYNAYAHFLVRYGIIVQDVPKGRYRQVLSEFVEAKGKQVEELSEEEILYFVNKFKELTDLPEDPYEQLYQTLKAMYDGWYDGDAVANRAEALHMPIDNGLAIIVQTVVMGSAGTAFSRNPVTGESGLFGCIWSTNGQKIALQDYAQTKPEVYQRLSVVAREIEKHFTDAIQMEFVAVENEQEINILQLFPARRTPAASVRIAVDLAAEHLVNERDAVLRVNVAHPNALWTYSLESKHDSDIVAHGQCASRGIVTGVLAFTSDEAMELTVKGHDVILVQFSGDLVDDRLLSSISGLVLIVGGVMNQAAVLTRALGKPCITDVSGVKLEKENGGYVLRINQNESLYEGMEVTLAAGEGRLYRGSCEKAHLFVDDYFREILHWSDMFRNMKVESKITGGHVPMELNTAQQFQADNVGCISTEHMFSSTEDRLTLTRLILISKTPEDRQTHILALQDLHQQDFANIFRSISAENPVIGIKLLDESLSRFLTCASEQEVQHVATSINVTVKDVKSAVHHFHDHNPDTGLRGCRIAALHPEVIELQLMALFKAVLTHHRDTGALIRTHIWIPGVSSSLELSAVLRLISRTYERAVSECDVPMGSIENAYSAGVVLDTPRACIRCDTLAAYVNSFAIDLNRLTANVYGCTKLDAERLFPRYVLEKIYAGNPFQSIDDQGVGALLKHAVTKARSTLQLKAGSIDVEAVLSVSVIEGDHVWDKRSINFLHSIGVDSICCPVDKIPLVKILAAQALIEMSKKRETEWFPDLDGSMAMF